MKTQIYIVHSTSRATHTHTHTLTTNIPLFSSSHIKTHQFPLRFHLKLSVHFTFLCPSVFHWLPRALSSHFIYIYVQVFYCHYHHYLPLLQATRSHCHFGANSHVNKLPETLCPFQPWTFFHFFPKIVSVLLSVLVLSALHHHNKIRSTGEH